MKANDRFAKIFMEKRSLKIKKTLKKYTSFWYVSKKYGDKTGLLFNDLDNVFSCRGEQISSDPISRVIKVFIDGQCYYVKTYTAGGKRIRRYIGRSRIRADWENLIFFDSLGIPVPEIVACGQEICFGIFKRGALITKEVPDSTDLAYLAQKGSKRLKNKAWMERVGFLYSEYARRLHANRFIHVDMKWRNILVTKGEKPEVYFIDCPSGKKVIFPLFTHGKIKDLACLDKIARYHLSPATRLRFYKNYTGRDDLSKEDKKLIKKIVTFYKRLKM